jgi:hypothetical protein
MCWIRHRLRSLFFIRLFYSREQKGVTAFIFGGSVAKGMERADSDLDGMAVVSQREFKYREQHNELTEVIQGKCIYEGGYFDVKYITKDFLKAAAQKGSEPTRNSFYRARVMFSDDPEIPDLVTKIAAFQEDSDISVVSGRYQLDFEKWWYIPRPLAGEW